MIAAVLLVVAVLVGIRPWWAPSRAVRPAHGAAASPPRRVPLRAGGPAWGVVVGACLVVAPPIAMLALGWPTVRGWRRRRADRAAHQRSVVRALPASIDLLIVAVGAGLAPRAAIVAASPWMPEPIGGALRAAVVRSDRGEPLADALTATCHPLGEPVLPVVNLLGGGAGELGVGARLPALVRLGDEARRRRRAEAQERARRLPVTMLVPLVLCVLPAFVLIGLVPLVVASLGDLGIDP